MKSSSNIMLLQNEITLLRKKLDILVHNNPMNSKKVLELSKELDVLIVGYYNLKKAVSS